MTRLQRWAGLAAALLGLMGLGGCTTTSLLLGAAGVASDNSVTWEVVKHLHAKMTEGDAKPCMLLDSVDRALNPRCGEFVRGSLRSKDVAQTALGECPLVIAARDPRLWPVLPELLSKGALPESCAQSPLVELAQANDCPDLSTTSAEVKRSIVWLAQADSRAIHHDVVRWLSCPNSRAAGFEKALDGWLAAGALNPGTLSFSPLAALHPSYLRSTFGVALEVEGHTAADALGAYAGLRSPGFEEALRTSEWGALEWWLSRLPQLANRVPPQQGNQLAWLPLAKVLVPNFLTHPESRADMVQFLMARGANPRVALPSNPGQSVIGLARAMKSPLAEVMAAAPAKALPPSVVAVNSRALIFAGE